MLATRECLWRTILSAAIVAGMLLGGLVWTDDAWPFAPFRMFSHPTKRDSVVLAATFTATTSSGEQLELDSTEFGLRRAEVEDQMDAIVAAPEDRLGALAHTWNDRHGAERRLVALELRQRGDDLEGGEPVGRIDRVLAVWHADRERDNR